MSDLISRADAIEAVAQQWLFEASVGNPYVNDDDIGEYRKIAEALFEDVPSADAVQGEWKHTITGQPYCSNCEYVFGEDEEFSPFWKYCPMCGAKMKGGAE